MVSERYNFDDCRFAGDHDDVGKLEFFDDSQKVKHLDAFLEGLELEIPPLE